MLNPAHAASQDILQTQESNFSQNPVASYEEIRAACVCLKESTVRDPEGL